MIVLRQIRKSRKISLEELSAATGVGISTLSHLERGNSDPKLGTLIKCARFLRVQVGDLFESIEYDKEGENANR